jgi:hypothetical protein
MGFWGGLAKVAGGVGGFIVGGPAGAAAGYGLASSLTDHGGGGGGSSGDLAGAAGQYGTYAKDSRNRFMDALSGGQSALEASTKAAVSNALPGYMKDLQHTREDAIRRGASNGDLETSYEGDLSSAFQRNVANSVAGQAAGMQNARVNALGQLAGSDSNTYLDLLSGQADRDQAGSNNKWNLAGSVLGAAGQAAGAYFGRRT